ncbi:hypothetical protein [Actinoplanes lobatus]|uniref:Uncharacterized protein n=1 Tax=Actinoplanes lobatus TaxID=113568 RepID=A0A7W7HB03_9ACTN|nr:hypothetical protein [Actinoplanes lobatus]MBB4747158.1 hypothetical protein [Actinoplanes lobatus]
MYELPVLDQRIPGSHLHPLLRRTRFVGVAKVPSGFVDDLPVLEKVLTALRQHRNAED